MGILGLQGDIPTGAAWLRLLTGDLRGYSYVDEVTPELSMAVLPDFRGQGIGTQLLAALLEQASSRFPAVCLSVAKDNPAERLYLRFGFRAVGEHGSSKTMVKTFVSGHNGKKA